jgi:hypothetical protein
MKAYCIFLERDQRDRRDLQTCSFFHRSRDIVRKRDRRDQSAFDPADPGRVTASVTDKTQAGFADPADPVHHGSKQVTSLWEITNA